MRNAVAVFVLGAIPLIGGIIFAIYEKAGSPIIAAIKSWTAGAFLFIIVILSLGGILGIVAIVFIILAKIREQF